MSDLSTTADGRIAAIARRQHGVVTVGHRGLSWRGRWLAAVLAAGDGAVLSHTSAAALWKFLRPIQGPIRVSLPAAVHRSPRPGLRLHRSRTLTRRDITRLQGIAVTTPARTIDDIRGEVEPYLFRRALRQAELAGHRVPHLGVVERTRSDLELLFLALCEAHGLPRPEVNVRVGPHLVDFVWPAQRVAVETDSWEYHRGSVAFEDDHERNLALGARGFTVRRYTGDQLEAASAAVAADLRQALGLAS